MELIQLSEVKTPNNPTVTQHINSTDHLTTNTNTLHHLSPQQKLHISASLSSHQNMHQENSLHHANPKLIPSSSSSPPSPSDYTTLCFPGLIPANAGGHNLPHDLHFDSSSKDPGLHHFDVSVINERRLRRMISNRESARRSRLRKKKQIEELQVQVDQLRGVNNNLSEKLISLLESNHQIMQENAQLKEKVSSLQIIVTDLLSPLRSVEEVANNNGMNSETSHPMMRSEASHRSVR